MEDKHELQQQFIVLRAKGNSYDRIASKLSVSKATLIDWSKQLSVEISNHRSLENDALLEKHKLAKSHQMDMFGVQLNKIRTELEKRDLSDVSTDKLVSMELKLLEAVNANGSSIMFTTAGWALDTPEHQWQG